MCRMKTNDRWNRNMIGAAQRTLTIFFQLDFCSFIFPEDGGRRWTDDVTDDVCVVSLGKLLGWGCIREGDFFWNINMQNISLLCVKDWISAGVKNRLHLVFYSRVQTFVKCFLKIKESFHTPNRTTLRITLAISSQSPYNFPVEWR